LSKLTQFQGKPASPDEHSPCPRKQATVGGLCVRPRSRWTATLGSGFQPSRAAVGKHVRRLAHGQGIRLRI
ncbi:MAG: hypothetical protein ACE5JA_11210, partial [bacterium]